MDAVSAWVGVQRDRKRQEWRCFRGAAFKEWGQPSGQEYGLFKSCCTQWLMDGPLNPDMFEYDDYTIRAGCDGCKKEHPMITLGFDPVNVCTTATMSHPLSRFINYFDRLKEEGKAHQDTVNPQTYRLEGYLRPNSTFMRRSSGLKPHLIKIDESSMEASDAAQLAELEAKPPAKKPRTETSSATKSDDPYNFDDDDELDAEMVAACEKVEKPPAEKLRTEKSSATASGDDPYNFDDDDELDAEMVAACEKNVENRKTSEEFNMAGLESVLILVHETMELKHDPLALHVLRRTCKSTKVVAERLAKQKLASLDLTITPLVDGRYRSEEGNFECYDSENCSKVDEALNFVCYEKRDVMKLSFATDGYFHPLNGAAATFSWDSGSLRRDYVDDDNDCSDEKAYRGQIVRLSWHTRHKSVDLVQPAVRTDLYGGVLPSLGLNLAEFHLGDCPNRGIVTKTSISGYIIAEYEVLESNTQEITEEVEQGGDDEYYDDDEDEREVVTRRSKSIRYSGTIKINRIKVDFGKIVSEHAFRVQQNTKREHRKILKERPLTGEENAYYRMLSEAMRVR